MFIRTHDTEIPWYKHSDPKENYNYVLIMYGKAKPFGINGHL